MADRGCDNGCRRVDRYANPINLTYNQRKEYPTCYGGALSIFTAIVIIAWLAVQCLHVYQGTFEVIETQQLAPPLAHYNVS